MLVNQLLQVVVKLFRDRRIIWSMRKKRKPVRRLLFNFLRTSSRIADLVG